MERVKEGGGEGKEGRKETLADKPLDFENRPRAHWDVMLSSAVINKPIKSLAFRSGSELWTKINFTCQNMSETTSARWERRNLDELNLVIYDQAIFLLNPSKRKDCKGDILTQICKLS